MKNTIKTTTTTTTTNKNKNKNKNCICHRNTDLRTQFQNFKIYHGFYKVDSIILIDGLQNVNYYLEKQELFSLVDNFLLS